MEDKLNTIFNLIILIMGSGIPTKYRNVDARLRTDLGMSEDEVEELLWLLEDEGYHLFEAYTVGDILNNKVRDCVKKGGLNEKGK